MAEVARRDLFVSGEDGYHTYRIPSLLATPEGALLAFCEGRRDGPGDHGDVDLLVRRSADGGRTWDEKRVVYGDVPWADVTIGNPCPVADEETGTIWLPFTRDNRDVLVAKSVDDGRTWTDPVDVTSQVKRSDWTWYATGPGVGVQLQRGPHAGRIVIPCDHGGPAVGTYRPEVTASHVVYSDDYGQTWHAGEPVHPHTNECQVVELADGRLLLNARNQLGSKGGRPERAGARIVATSDDGGETWSETEFDERLVEPGCQASLIRCPTSEADESVLLFSNPADREERVRLTVRRSEDGGVSWPHARVLADCPIGYSCLSVLPDGRVGCLYECGDDDYRERIRLARFDSDWLTG